MSDRRRAVHRASIMKTRSRTSGNDRYFEPILDYRAEHKWDVFLSHMEKLGQIVFIEDDAFINIGFSKLHKLSYTNGTKKKIKSIRKILILVLMLPGCSTVLAVSP